MQKRWTASVLILLRFQVFWHVQHLFGISAFVTSELTDSKNVSWVDQSRSVCVYTSINQLNQSCTMLDTVVTWPLGDWKKHALVAEKCQLDDTMLLTVATS